MADDIEIFDVNKFIPYRDTSGTVDGSDGYANLKQMYISFLHVPSGKAVYFKAFLTTFNEAFNSTWAEEEVYGRPDPIYLFKNTKRKISLAFKAPAFSEDEAFENLGKVQQLTQFLYPNYTTVGGDIYAQTISQSPLVRLKVMNLVANQPIGTSQENENGRTHNDLIAHKQAIDSSPEMGLLGVIDNITVLHNLEKDGGFNEGPGVILPKVLEVNLNFSPIHEHALGWDEKGNFSNTLFPFGVDLPGTPDALRGVQSAGLGLLGLDSADEELADTNAVWDSINKAVAEPVPGADVAASAAVVDAAAALAGLGATSTMTDPNLGAISLGGVDLLSGEAGADAAAEAADLGEKAEGDLPTWD